MPTTSRRHDDPALEIFRSAQMYLYLREQKLAAERAFADAAKPIKSWLIAKDDDGKLVNGEEDSEGNRIFRFSRPVDGNDGKTYDGVMMRRRQSPASFDPDEIMDFARKRHLADQLIETVEIPDLDALYDLHQEGIVTDAEMAELMHIPPPTYALWPMEVVEDTEED